ncbi:4-hydroxythreonine-4-phosphate dehydrogenase PdxA [Streptomyces sp. ML-6]|uniref:4-hydroxythreonine-4-phosphate dehydrogenase PdxA n=1 Tax=Streptomyces sp. ML-6 TaxID=2982693 RepID=UPI0024BFDA11|nr:4-hydroxythreonine-4-phosphate dehydrogenase PdxA [Streptomyces sp. ML-6]MDK0524514.1 4-hydroxythreonine-4-phosphate dehydrogenase PdxA [Streptomyces sp. ML-6]
MPLVVIGDPGVLARAAEVVGPRLALRPIPSVDRAAHTPGTVDVIAGSDLPDDLPRGTLDARAGAAAFQYVRQGIRLALNGDVRALVTAPINKEALRLAGVPPPRAHRAAGRSVRHHRLRDDDGPTTSCASSW